MNSTTKAGMLLNAIRASHDIFTRLCNDYGAEELWQSRLSWEELGFTERMRQRLSGFILDDWAEKEQERIENFGARFIVSGNIDYPVKLYGLNKPPIGLYVKGNVNLSLPSVAIVGTRKCTVYAEGVAEELGRSLARMGIMTVSGGAKGVDTAGHRGTLSEDGVTVVVFGTGLDKIYPAENRDLFARILYRGAWVSEYPFGTNGNTWRFPERDRIIAAMSSHVVVAESPEDGGAMYTGRTGIELGRDVWSIPGRITDDVSRGTNLLLREGSNVFVGISDFISTITEGREQISIDFGEHDDVSWSESTSAELTDNGKVIYSLLQRSGGRMTDELLAESGMDFMTLQEVLMELECEGLIRSEAGRYFVTS